MKTSTILGCFACVLGIAFVYANAVPEQASEEIKSNAQPKIKSMRSSTTYSQCSDIFHANINSSFGVYSEYKKTCAQNAEEKRNNNNYIDNNLGSGGSRRTRVENYVLNIVGYFKECAAQNGLFFHVCLAEKIDDVIDNLFNIKNIVETAIASDGNDYESQPGIGITTNVDEEEEACLSNAINLYKEENERHLNMFNACMNTAGGYYYNY